MTEEQAKQIMDKLQKIEDKLTIIGTIINIIIGLAIGIAISLCWAM